MDRDSIVMQAMGMILVFLVLIGDALAVYAMLKDFPWVVHNGLMVSSFVCFLVVSNIALIALIIIFYQAFKPMKYDRDDNYKQQKTEP